jgi:WD40 repeat protein
MNSSGGHSINSSRSDNSMDDTVIDNSFSSSSSSSSRPDSTSTLAPLFQFNDHVAAVKAVAWSPHQNGLLASGGGTADRTIRYWNTLTGACVHAVDTGSQVCNLVWSASVNEVVSTHGYSLNQIIVWKYPSMHKVATLTGHSTRVVYLAMSPDGQSIVTGAGDETLRFWHLFPSGKSSSLGEGTTSNSKYTSSVHNHLYERNSLTDGYARCGNVSDVLVPTGNSIR